MTPTSIDLILGADVYADLIFPGLITGPPVTPIAQSIIFGWILSCPKPDKNQTGVAMIQNHCNPYILSTSNYFQLLSQDLLQR